MAQAKTHIEIQYIWDKAPHAVCRTRGGGGAIFQPDSTIDIDEFITDVQGLDDADVPEHICRWCIKNANAVLRNPNIVFNPIFDEEE